MELLTAIIAGLGLFFLGMQMLGQNLRAATGQRSRAILARATAGPVTSAISGVLLGGMTQSSNAATFIATSLQVAGLIPLQGAVRVAGWSNVGTAGLVLLATVDLKLAVLWLLGIVGFASSFGLDRAGRLKPVLGAALGVGLLFLGLDLIRTAAVPLRDLPLVQAALAGGHGGLWLPFLAAAGVTMVAQSSSTVTILAITLSAAGLLAPNQAVMVVYGASLGSGLAMLVLMGELRGTARQIALSQLLFKVVGTALFLLLFLAEAWGRVPLVLGLLDQLGDAPGPRLAALFLLFQTVTALVMAGLNGGLLAVLARLSPPRPVEQLARPRYLYAQAMEDATTALALVEREQRHLLARLPLLLDPWREGGRPAEVSAEAMLEATGAVEREVALFLGGLLGRSSLGASMARAMVLESRAALFASLRETVGDYATIVATARGTEEPFGRLLSNTTEALHVLLCQLAEAAESGDPDDLAVVRKLTADRGEMMEGLRRRSLQAGIAGDLAARDALFRGTATFERAVWLIRRLALLLEPETVEAPATAAA